MTIVKTTANVHSMYPSLNENSWNGIQAKYQLTPQFYVASDLAYNQSNNLLKVELLYFAEGRRNLTSLRIPITGRMTHVA